MDETIRTVKKNRATDIIIKLKPREKETKNTLGLLDNRLFKGENDLHAIIDTQTCLWYLRYDSGTVPEPFKQKFTGWTPLIKFVTEYLNKRGVDITEIID